jgi:BirA family biotin operon repressor/biotin-[acetyl-CoA-carboxylase] ligase
MDRQALDWQAVVARRQGRWTGRPIIYRPSLASTHTLAAQLIPDHAPPGSAVVTDYQFAGRGRLGRRWIAAPYSALTVTVVLGPLRPAWTAPLACGLAALEAIEAVEVRAALKWPNDLLVEGKKCGGVLIEAHPVAGVSWLLAGIGLNVRSSDPSLAQATYLDAHRPAPVSREILFEHLLTRLDHWTACAERERAVLHAAWRARLITLGRQVQVQTPAEAFEGLALDVSDDGGLVVQMRDGRKRIAQAGDVTLSATPF